MRTTALAVLLGCAPALLPACSSCGASSAPAAGEAGVGAAGVEPPVPAPDGLRVEGWVRSPDATWAKLQQGISGAVALLPPSVGEIACGFAGIDSRVARFVDGKGTSYALLAQGGSPSEVAWALALPLTDPAAAAALLTDGTDAQPARVTARDVGGMRVLAGRDRPLSAAVAIAPGRLLLASTDEALARLGPYAYRTMPTKPAPPGTAGIVLSVPPSALGGPLASGLAARWDAARAELAARDEEQRSKHGGRAPDFGDPRAILADLDAAVRRRLAMLASARGARAEIDAGDDDVRADLFVSPGEGDAGGDWLAAMHTGDTAPLAQSPADAIVALLARDDVAGRAEAARDLEGALDRALGDRLHDEDARALHAAIDGWARARGDWWTAGLAWGPGDSSRGVWVRTPAADAGAASHAVRDLVDLTRRKPLDEALSSLHLAPASFATPDVPSFGKATVATFPWTAPRGAKPVSSLAVAWGTRGGELVLAAGPDGPALLAASASPGRRLVDDARTSRALAGLGSDASGALVAQPLRFDEARAGGEAASAPAVVGWGRKGTEAWARIDVADALVRELVRAKAGL